MICNSSKHKQHICRGHTGYTTNLLYAVTRNDNLPNETVFYLAFKDKAILSPIEEEIVGGLFMQMNKYPLLTSDFSVHYLHHLIFKRVAALIQKLQKMKCFLCCSNSNHEMSYMQLVYII